MVKRTNHLYMYMHIQCSYVKTGEKPVDTADAP